MYLVEEDERPNNRKMYTIAFILPNSIAIFLKDSLVASDGLASPTTGNLIRDGIEMLLLVPNSSSCLSASLHLLNHILILPSDLRRESSESTELKKRVEKYQPIYLSALLQTQDAKSRRNNNAFLLIIRRRNALETLQPGQGFLSPVQLVRQHSSNCTPKYLGRSTIVVRAA